MIWILLSSLLALPVLLLCAQLLAAMPARSLRTLHAGARPPLAILVPAHNEAAGIAITLASILRQLTPEDRLLVVADNCDDHTAAIARAAGASVIERHHAQQRGKAYALAYGLQWLAQTPPAIVICIDADCTLGDDALN